MHAKTYRHTVLPVLACNDLIMSTDAKIGEGRGTQRDRPSGYCRYVRPGRGIEKEAVVLKMLDKNITVVEGGLKGTTVYVDLDKIRKRTRSSTGCSSTRIMPRLFWPREHWASTTWKKQIGSPAHGQIRHLCKSFPDEKSSKNKPSYKKKKSGKRIKIPPPNTA